MVKSGLVPLPIKAIRALTSETSRGWQASQAIPMSSKRDLVSTNMSLVSLLVFALENRSLSPVTEHLTDDLFASRVHVTGWSE